MRTPPNHCDVPIIVLSTSDNLSDIRAATDEGAAALVTKAPDFEGLEAIVQRLLYRELPRRGVPT